MLFKIDPKYNTEEVRDLMSKRTYFIGDKLPTLRRWTINKLYNEGISIEALEWRYKNIPVDKMVDDLKDGVPTGEKILKKIYTTKEKEFGKYRYNKQGIPTKVGEYITDISSRDIAHNVTSIVLGKEEKDFINKVLQVGLLSDSQLESDLRKLIEDITVLGTGMMTSENFDLIREVLSWTGLKDGKYKWSKKDSLPYKRGVYTRYIDPETVFPEPDTETPTEMFVGKPYTYGELILNYPELKDKVNKPSVATHGL